MPRLAFGVATVLSAGVRNTRFQSLIDSCTKTLATPHFSLESGIFQCRSYFTMSSASTGNPGESKPAKTGRGLLNEMEVKESYKMLNEQWKVSEVHRSEKGTKSMSCLRRLWEMKSFLEGMAFLNDVAKIAEVG